MTHDYHQGLEGYSENQILHDGCGECEGRAKRADRGINDLDERRFARAWARAAQWQRAGLPDGSYAELPLLKVLWAVQVHLERRLGWPVGTLPPYPLATPEDLAKAGITEADVAEWAAEAERGYFVMGPDGVPYGPFVRRKED